MQRLCTGNHLGEQQQTLKRIGEMSSEVAKIWTSGRSEEVRCLVREHRELKATINVVLDCLHIVAGYGFDLGEFGNGISPEILRSARR